MLASQIATSVKRATCSLSSIALSLFLVLRIDHLKTPSDMISSASQDISGGYYAV